ncbi:MAG: hypothetical protein HY422_01825 [Candidatus Komeilibacteria bacterium]|nr:hypothetical protein [Candidatus Komeilibacteria bacterium]
MKTVRSKTGPFTSRPHFKLNEIEEICATELKAVGLYPSTPEPVRIDRFIEKHFKISHEYDDLPNGVLGFTKFGRHGVEAIVVARSLDGDHSGKLVERRLRTTLAHEAGHGLLHKHLFALGAKPKSLFGDSDEKPEILCRDIPGEQLTAPGYDGRWWEFQANKAIGGLLMPRRLVELAADRFTAEVGSFGSRTLIPEKREVAIRALADIFDVNPIVARIRLEDIFSSKQQAQLLL